MSQRLSTTESEAAVQTGSVEAGISRLLPGSSGLADDPVVMRDVGPQYSEWLPELLDELVPTIERTVRELAHNYDPRILRDERPRLFPTGCLQRKHGVGVPGEDGVPIHPFNYAVSKLAIAYGRVIVDDLSEPKRQRYDWARQVVTGVGTREYPGAPNGVGLLDETIVPLLDAGDHTPSVVLSLDEAAWTDVDKRSATSALDALAMLSEVLNIGLVLSPRLDDHLRRTYPDWYDEHLTEPRDETSIGGDHTPSADALSTAWGIVGGFTPRGGRLRLLYNLDADSERAVRDLKADSEIDLSPGAVDRYTRELADEHGLVAIDDRPKYNRVSLTSCGKAAQSLITPDYRAVHPRQTQFQADNPGTRQSTTGIVCCPKPGDGPTPSPGDATADRTAADATDRSALGASSLAESAPTAEEWLADTGEAHEDGYTPWLAGPNGRLDRWKMHERLLAGKRTEGVTVVDDDIESFDDGRVTYVSCFEDEVLVAAQWGGPLPTLVRVTSALLSNKMWSKVLVPSKIGGDLEELYGGELHDTIKDVLRLGAQMGWLGENEANYEGFSDRYRQVRDLVLSKLPGATDGGSTEWSDLAKDAHGLLASVTQLYHALGIDVTINLRIPDTRKLRAGTSRYRRFLDFMRHTVPKNAAYGVHSVYRLLCEDRVDKLKHRMSIEFGPNPTADLTASWTISGPTASKMTDDIRSAIAAKADDIRETIREGVERGVRLQVPVVDGNGYTALRSVVERHADRKGFDVDREQCREIIRLATATLGTEPGRCSPYALAEALLAMAKARSVTDSLTTADVAHGLTRLPAHRLMPTLKSTMQKALKVLLVADEPLGRSEIVERAGISGRSYDRNISELAAVGLVESVGNGGHKKWRAWVMPWWSPLVGTDTPRTADGDESGVSPSSRVDDVLYQLALDLGLDPAYELFANPIDIEDVFDALPRLERWRHWFTTHYGLVDLGSDTATESGDLDAESIVALGVTPAERDAAQTALATN